MTANVCYPGFKRASHNQALPSKRNTDGRTTRLHNASGRRRAEALCSRVVRPSVRPSVCPSESTVA